MRGGYFNLDSAPKKEMAWSVRYGWNNTGVDVSNFLSVSTLTSFDDDALGVGIAWHKLAEAGVNEGDPLLFEVYYRWQLTGNLALTPDLQVWSNANGLVSDDVITGTAGGNAVVYGLRLQYSDDFTY